MIDVGTQFGTYRIQEKLGEGGMGVVYRAVDTELQRTVAIKTLLSAPDAESLSRFLREAKAASRLQHPTIVTIYHVGVEGETRYIVMEYVEGQTLKKMINGRPVSVPQLCDVAIQVADGLVTAHEMGVIHRDIKAENVIVTRKGQVKILDFGLAKLHEIQGADTATIMQTEAGVVLGTVSHMSPEQAMAQEVDTRTDVFSFGVMLYEMATGRMPFAAATAQATLARVLNHEPEPITAINSSVPTELEHVIRECLQKDRSLRPSAAEVLSMLRGVKDGLGGRPAAAGTDATVKMVLPTPKSGATTATAPVSGRLRPLAPTPVGTGSGSGKSARLAPAAGSSAAATVETTHAAPASPAVTALRTKYQLLRILRLAVSILTLTVPLAFFAQFIIGGGLIRPEVLEGTALLRFIQAVTTPVLEVATKVLTFRTVVDGWNLLLPVAGLAGFVLRRFICLPFERLERGARERLAHATRVETKAPVVTTAAPVGSHRMAMLREYAETKKLLFQQKRRLAFLAVEVVDASRMRAAEDKLVVEHAFAEYRKFIDRVLSTHNVWKTAWRSDSVLGAFVSLDAAVRSGQEIIQQLPWFNDGVHQLRHKFEVRCGVSAGEVVCPDDRELDEVTDETLDLSRQLQSAAAPGTLLVGRDTLAEVADQAGFVATEKPVAGQDVRAWKAN